MLSGGWVLSRETPPAPGPRGQPSQPRSGRGWRQSGSAGRQRPGSCGMAAPCLLLWVLIGVVAPGLPSAVAGQWAPGNRSHCLVSPRPRPPGGQSPLTSGKKEVKPAFTEHTLLSESHLILPEYSVCKRSRANKSLCVHVFSSLFGKYEEVELLSNMKHVCLTW